MTMVWVVSCYESYGEEGGAEAVFSTREKAEAYKNMRQPKSRLRFRVEEWELDEFEVRASDAP